MGLPRLMIRRLGFRSWAYNTLRIGGRVGCTGGVGRVWVFLGFTSGVATPCDQGDVYGAPVGLPHLAIWEPVGFAVWLTTPCDEGYVSCEYGEHFGCNLLKVSQTKLLFLNTLSPKSLKSIVCFEGFMLKCLKNAVFLDPDVTICVRGATDFQNFEDVPSETAKTSHTGRQ